MYLRYFLSMSFVIRLSKLTVLLGNYQGLETHTQSTKIILITHTESAFMKTWTSVVRADFSKHVMLLTKV